MKTKKLLNIMTETATSSVISKENYPQDSATKELFPYKDYVFEKVLHENKWIDSLINFILGLLIIGAFGFYIYKILTMNGGLN